MTTTTPNLGFQNWFSTTLASGITATDTVIYLNSLPTPSEGFLVIEPDSTTNREIIFYNSKGANFVTVPSVSDRGVGGTTAVSHSSGVTVQMNIVAEHFEALQDGTAFAVGGIGASAYEDGWAPILGVTPNTITYNGNRNYDLVFNSNDLTDTLSPGMKLKLTRTVAAPDQCADLEASSSQYFSKTSPAGMTFTDDFTCMAWIKPESYATGVIMQRYNGTNGFQFYIDSEGMININGTNAGNADLARSYASVPLNKWIHVAATLNMSAATATIYMDGTLVASSYTNGSATALVQAGDLSIGRNQSGTAYFDGKLAQVAIFSSVLDAATIRSYASQGLSGSESTLISAYSFDNSTTDLNTTNANNLTANGGAAATNADSPFANAVTAGLQEYAEVNSVSFSTNTTVNVRVPETCMIPTTGGISASYYAVGAYPYGLPAFSNILGEAILGANKNTTATAIASATNVEGLSTTVYIPKGRKVKITVNGYAFYNSGTAQSRISIFDGTVGSGTLIGLSAFGTGGTNIVYAGTLVQCTYQKDGSVTFNIGIHTGGSGTTSLESSSPSLSTTGAYFTKCVVELV